MRNPRTIVPRVLPVRVSVPLLLAMLCVSAPAADGITVEIASPSAGAEVGGQVEVEVRAQSEAAPVRRIEVVMGALSAVVEGSEGAVTLDVGALEPGLREIVATAEDEAGNRGIARIEVQVVEESPFRLWMEPDPEAIAPGETSSVRVHLGPADGLAGVQFALTWDPEILELEDGVAGVKAGAAVPEGAPPPVVNAQTDGRLVVLVISPEAEFAAAESEIIVIRLRAREGAPAGEAALTWGDRPGDLLISDSQARLVEPDPERVDGHVTIRTADEPDRRRR